MLQNRLQPRMEDFKMKFGSLIIAAALLAPIGAQAADLKIPPQAAYKAPPIESYVDPWTGFYIGGAIGYGWNRGAGIASATTESGTGESSFATSPQGVVGGLHLGLGTRFGGNFYIGAEIAGGIG